MVVLCNVAEVPEATARSLAGFVTAGGQLVIFTGDRVSPGAYASLRRSGIFPAQVQEPVDPGVFRCTRWQKDHPIFRPFDQPEHGDLRTLKFDRITRLVPDPQARELAAVEGNLPLLRRIVGWDADGACSWPCLPTTSGATGPSSGFISP